MENNEALEVKVEAQEQPVEQPQPKEEVVAEVPATDNTPNKVYEELRKANNRIQELEKENEELKKSVEKVAELEAEISNLKASNGDMSNQIKATHNNALLEELGIDTKYSEDIVALIIGKGEEVNDETITKYAQEHNEWKKSVVETQGVRELGATKNSAETSDREKFHNWWNS